MVLVKAVVTAVITYTKAHNKNHVIKHKTLKFGVFHPNFVDPFRNLLYKVLYYTLCKVDKTLT